MSLLIVTFLKRLIDKEGKSVIDYGNCIILCFNTGHVILGFSVEDDGRDLLPNFFFNEH